MSIYYSAILRNNDITIVEASRSSNNYPMIPLKDLQFYVVEEGFKSFANHML